MPLLSRREDVVVRNVFSRGSLLEIPKNNPMKLTLIHDGDKGASMPLYQLILQ